MENFKLETPKVEDYMNEILNRFSSPITGTFIIAFLSRNWELAFKVFSSSTPLDKSIQTVKEASNWCDFVFWPLGMTLAYFFVMPFLLYWYNKLNDYIKRVEHARNLEHEFLISNMSAYHRTITLENYISMAKLVTKYSMVGEEVSKKVMASANGHAQTMCEPVLLNLNKQVKSLFVEPDTEFKNFEEILKLRDLQYFRSSQFSFENSRKTILRVLNGKKSKE